MSTTTKTLSEICTITSSKRIFRSEYQETGVPFYRGREIIEKQKGRTKLSAELFISESKYTEIMNKFGAPQTGDLLLTSVGTIGIPYVVKEDDKFYFKDGNLTWFKDFKETNSTFLYYWLLSAKGKAQLKKATIGTSQSALTIVLLKRLEIELPSIREQNRVSEILSAYDSLIENNSKRIEKLETMAQLIYVHSLSKGAFEVPISNLTTLISRGISPKYADHGESIVLNQRCIRDQKIDFSFARRQSKSIPATKILSEGDILINSTGVGTLGRVAQVYGQHHNTSVDSHVSIVRPNKDVNLYYFGAALLDKQTDFERLGTGATGQTELSREAIGRVKIKLPSTEVQEMVGAWLKDIRRLTNNLQQQNVHLARARNLLITRLISREIEV